MIKETVHDDTEFPRLHYGDPIMLQIVTTHGIMTSQGARRTALSGSGN